MLLKKVAFAAALAIGVAGIADAHHGIAGEFDQSKMVTKTGVISKVSWVNPHIYMTLDVKDESGAITKYQLESVPVAFARKAGITKEELLGNGQNVTVTGMQARKVPNLLFAVLMKYANGHVVSFSGFKE